jgi:dihydrofolate reductase
VISRTKSFDPTDAECFDSIERAIAACQNNSLAFIIGGAQVYEQALELDVVHQMIITEVDIDVVGDAHFPNFNQADWHETSRTSFPSAADPKDPSRLLPAYAFVNYSRQI